MAVAMNATRKPYLKDGGDWAVHEDFIIGDEAGLSNLRRAIDVALQDGQYSGNDLGQWSGVRLVDDEWIANPRDPKVGRIAGFLTVAFVVGLIGLFGLGVIAGLDQLLK